MFIGNNMNREKIGMHLHISEEIYGIYLKLICLSPIMQASGSAISEGGFPTGNRFSSMELRTDR
jgi:hypothetical protein